MKSWTIKGNVMTLTVRGTFGIAEAVNDNSLESYSVQRLNIEDWEVSFPMTKAHHIRFAPQIHRHNAEQRKKNQHVLPKGPEGTPPKGTPPRGGAGNTTEFVKTTAIAA